MQQLLQREVVSEGTGVEIQVERNLKPHVRNRDDEVASAAGMEDP